jgi:uncharacterized delta-60 repeat protein
MRRVQRRGGIAAPILILLLGLGAGVMAFGQLTRDPLWVESYNGPADEHDVATSVACDHLGNVIVTGQSDEAAGGPTDIVTLKYSPTGSLLWPQRYGLYPGRADSAASISIDGLDNIYIVGTSRDSANRCGITILKYQPNGTQAWARRYCDTLYQTFARGSVVDAGGNLYAAGYRHWSADSFDYLLLKYDPSGDTVWQRTLRVPNTPGPWFQDPLIVVCLDPLGHIYVAGPMQDTTGGYGEDYLTLKYSLDGDLLWSRTYGGEAGLNDYPVAVTSDDSGNVYVCGSSASGTEYDYSVVKYNRDGEYLFEARYNYQEYNGWEIPYSVAVDAEHYIYVSGYSESDLGGDDYCTVKFQAAYDTIQALVDTIWVNRYDRSGDQDDVYGMVVDKSGNVYVTGLSYDASTSADITTIRYAKDGSTAWVGRYNLDPLNPDDDYGYAIAQDAIGNVYVAGASYEYNSGRQDYAVLAYQGTKDAGVARIVEPSQDSVRTNRAVYPKVMVRSYASMPLSFAVRIDIGEVSKTAFVSDLQPGESTLATFSVWVPEDSGTFPIQAYPILAGDEDPRNDTAYGLVVVTLPWLVRADVPIGAKKRKVKDGGALAYADIVNNVYCMKGNNTLEFYAYNCSSLTWTSRESVPFGTGRRKVKKGGALVYGGNNVIYATKGNRRTEFWAYDVIGRTWTAKTDMPAPLKEGVGMTYVRTQNRIYVLQGSNLTGFWAYSIIGDSFTTKSAMPLGISGKRPKDGSALCYDGLSTIYALKGKTSEFFAYNINSDSWVQKPGVPLIGRLGKKKKIGGGGSLAFADGMVYAFKGNNSDEFWCYSPPHDSWTESDSMLAGMSHKRVKGGGALTTARNKVYALKGNNTLEFYLYNSNIQDLLARFVAPGAQGRVTDRGAFGLRVAPNPFRNSAMVTYSLPRAGRVRLVLFDVAGRLATDLFSGPQAPGVYRLKVSDTGLASGVYFLKVVFDDGVKEQQLTSKLLVQR